MTDGTTFGIDERAREGAGLSSSIVPELYVSDIEASKRFYTRGLGFEVAYERPPERFACLRIGDGPLLLEQPESFARADASALRAGRWIVAPTERPFGRGLNLQVTVPSVEGVASRLRAIDWPVLLPPHERTYRVSGAQLTLRVILVQDPDGYLIRLCESSGDGAQDPGGP